MVRGIGPADSVIMLKNPRTYLAAILLLTAALAGCKAAGGNQAGESPSAPSAGSAGSTQPITSSQPASSAPSNSSAPPSSPAPSSRAGSANGVSAPASVHPGTATPADAVDGYYQAIFQGNYALACTYVLQDEPCGGGSGPQATGGITIGQVEVSTSGIFALVEITGKLCGPGGHCESNSNPAAGLPTGSESVQRAWADSVVTGNDFAPTRAEESSSGGWYVDLTGNSD